MMIGVELASGQLATQTARALLGEGYVVLGGGLRGETLTFTPSLTIDEERIAPFVKTLRRVLDARPLAERGAGMAGRRS
ncbi:MAG: hypothetical protein R3F14_22080 [Polyangiaceae bacterium]